MLRSQAKGPQNRVEREIGEADAYVRSEKKILDHAECTIGQHANVNQQEQCKEEGGVGFPLRSPVHVGVLVHASSSVIFLNNPLISTNPACGTRLSVQPLGGAQ